jgi:hypothetical protein
MTHEHKTSSRSDDQDLLSWVSALYDLSTMDDDYLQSMYELFRYKGFDRQLMMKELMTKSGGDIDVARQLILLCALRGPRASSIIELKNGKTPIQMGIPASGMKGSSKLSCARITASTADLAASFLKQLNVPKRIHDSPLPAWLQFPSAGSITLPDNLRQQHIEFSRRFSTVIKGEFNESIYNTMAANSYLDENLNLFSV